MYYFYIVHLDPIAVPVIREVFSTEDVPSSYALIDLSMTGKQDGYVSTVFGTFLEI